MTTAEKVAELVKHLDRTDEGNPSLIVEVRSYADGHYSFSRAEVVGRDEANRRVIRHDDRRPVPTRDATDFLDAWMDLGVQLVKATR
jgi:hypothetical protein